MLHVKCMVICGVNDSKSTEVPRSQNWDFSVTPNRSRSMVAIPNRKLQGMGCVLSARAVAKGVVTSECEYMQAFMPTE